MCLNPISIRNPTKVVGRKGGQLLSLTVSCNNCAECKEFKRKEWRFRTYQECIDTFNCGGYVYFDTLTYDNEHLPHISDFVDINSYGIEDFSCFNLDHFRLFLKLLRRMLHYRYGLSSKAFKYYLVSEYGTDDRCTHRPHYHILFFVRDFRVSPLEFSRLVSECWPHGRTDGIPYQSSSYVNEHIYTSCCNNDIAPVLMICNYVSKYITKSSKFEKVLKSRLEVLRTSLSEEDVASLSRKINMFHRQSKGYGASFIYNMTDKEKEHLLLDNACYMPDKQKTSIRLPLCMYYKRKLMYNLYKRSDGSYYWQLREDMLPFYNGMKETLISQQVTKFHDFLSNITSEQYNNIIRLLNGRTIEDYFVYLTYYRGRLRDLTYNDLNRCRPKYRLSAKEEDLTEWLSMVDKSLFVDEHDETNFIFSEDRQHVFIPRTDDYDEYNMFDKVDYTRYKPIDYKNFVHVFTFNQGSDERFKHFDDLTLYISKITEDDRQKKQEIFDYKEELKDKLKQYGYVH